MFILRHYLIFSHDVFLLPPLTFKTCLPFVFRSVQKVRVMIEAHEKPRRFISLSIIVFSRKIQKCKTAETKPIAVGQRIFRKWR